MVKKQRGLAELVLVCVLAGCAAQPKIQSEAHHSNSSVRNKQMQEIDWNYSEALNTCEIPPRADVQLGSDLRPNVVRGLSDRQRLLLFKRLKDFVAGMNDRDYVICETYCPSWGIYDFIIVVDDLSKKGSLAYLGHKENVAEFSSTTEFDVLKKFIQESGIISIASNLEHFSADDGTYFFYTFHFDGKIYQTFCYTPYPYEGRTKVFYDLYEKLTALVKRP